MLSMSNHQLRRLFFIRYFKAVMKDIATTLTINEIIELYDIYEYTITSE